MTLLAHGVGGVVLLAACGYQDTTERAQGTFVLATRVAVGELNGDGRHDLVLLDHSGGEARVYLSRP